MTDAQKQKFNEEAAVKFFKNNKDVMYIIEDFVVDAQFSLFKV